MTMTHDAQINFQLPGRSFFTALATMPHALVLSVRRWHLNTNRQRTTAKLPAHLKRDIGEIDHMPTPAPTFMQSEPSSYQDRLQQMWLR